MATNLASEKVEEVPETVDEPEDKSTANEQVKTGKTFTQDELTKEVQARVRREQTKFGKERETWASERESLTLQAEEYATVVKDIIAEKSKDFAPALKNLFDKLSLKEQWEYLKNPDFVAQGKEKKSIPHTPHSMIDGQNPEFHRTQRV